MLQGFGLFRLGDGIASGRRDTHQYRRMYHIGRPLHAGRAAPEPLAPMKPRNLQIRNHRSPETSILTELIGVIGII
jgi:hypothetical protein